MKPKRKVLIIEDEVAIRRFLKAGMPDDEFELLEAASGKEGIRSVASHNPDVVLLDLGLPDIDGLEVTTSIREWSQVPIIVLSARGQEKDKIAALDNGADDYLTKPFGLGELLARIRVALRPGRRGGADTGEPIFRNSRFTVDLERREVKVGGVEVHFTPLEYKLLVLLIQNAGKVLTHRQLLTTVWGAAYGRETHYLRVFMKQLREKIEANPSKPVFFLTEPGVGYRFRADG